MLITSIEQIITNLKTLELYRLRLQRNLEYIQLIQRGRCFIPYIGLEGTLCFAPSRFVGYVGNNLEKHRAAKNKYRRDGRQTNPAISRLLGDHLENQKLEKSYKEFCKSLNIDLHNNNRTYWGKKPYILLKIEEDDRNAFEKEVEQSRLDTPKKRKERLKEAPKKPELTYSTIIRFKRNPDVVAEVLYRANGICERCNKNAPFKRATDGSPYLEVHHKIPLAEGGDDTVENAQALCPNCHRELHFG